MDLDMYAHPTVKNNLKTITQNGVTVLPAQSGELASGLVGQGRMQEPEDIFDFIANYFKPNSKYIGKKILITAGPTHEPIDPVRFIGNRSSGKMGYSIAKAALNLGADVTLVSGPTQLSLQHKNLNLIRVETAQQMFEASKLAFREADVAIFSAAVSDYSPKEIANQKIKKTDNLSIELEKTNDILKFCGQQKRENQLVIGFALESNNEEEYAKGKLVSKNADFIVLNSLNDKNATFGYDTNKVTVFGTNNIAKGFELMTKEKLAKELLGYFEDFLK
jgi:phosphopantothenoylcysteine decarboxylase/phosphopantothenate--cysteine ligase